MQGCVGSKYHHGLLTWLPGTRQLTLGQEDLNPSFEVIIIIYENLLFKLIGLLELILLAEFKIAITEKP